MDLEVDNENNKKYNIRMERCSLVLLPKVVSVHGAAPAEERYKIIDARAQSSPAFEMERCKFSVAIEGLYPSANPDVWV